jgi:hypothetical protein
MSKFISYYIRKCAAKFEDNIWSDKIKKDYNIITPINTASEYLSHLYKDLSIIPVKLIKDCKINNLKFEDLGPSREYYPNHGIYTNDGTLVLNYRMFEDPKEFEDNSGKIMSRFTHTLYHELGHGFDMFLGEEFSLKKKWLELSGWSEKPVPGLKRIVVKEEGCPEIRGEWFYDPKATFSRFYGKRNPWDDFADTFSFYVGGLKGIISKDKIKYFDDLLGKYYHKKRASVIAIPKDEDTKKALERYMADKTIEEYRKYIHSYLDRDEELLTANGYSIVDLTREKLKKHEEKTKTLRDELNKALSQHPSRMLKKASVELMKICHELLDFKKVRETEYLMSLNFDRLRYIG